MASAASRIAVDVVGLRGLDDELAVLDHDARRRDLLLGERVLERRAQHVELVLDRDAEIRAEHPVDAALEVEAEPDALVRQPGALLAHRGRDEVHDRVPAEEEERSRRRRAPATAIRSLALSFALAQHAVDARAVDLDAQRLPAARADLDREDVVGGAGHDAVHARRSSPRGRPSPRA